MISPALGPTGVLWKLDIQSLSKNRAYEYDLASCCPPQVSLISSNTPHSQEGHQGEIINASIVSP